MIGTEISGYTILRKIGEGGMAIIYYAQNNIGKSVAIKILKDQYSTNNDIKRRFRQEADIMMSLDNIDGIRKVIDRTETPDGKLAIILEYLDGVDLNEYIKRNGCIKDNKVIRDYCKQVLTALGNAHKRGIVHRDIKPSNLFLTTDGKVKILDFGISKILFGDDSDATERQTTTNKYFGTLTYMSPEQIKSIPDIDYRTDIYSFALTVFHLMTGENPADLDEYSMGGIEDERICRAIKNATIKNRDKRTQTCEQFLEDIFQQKTSVSEPPPKPRSEIKSASAPHPVKKESNTGCIVGGILIFVLLIVLIIIVLAKNNSEYDSRDDEPVENVNTPSEPDTQAVDSVVAPTSHYNDETEESSSEPEEDSSNEDILYEHYSIVWNFYNIQHQGILVLEGGSGLLEVSCYDRSNGQLVNVIQEDVSVTEVNDGWIINCSNVSSKYNRPYSADNFKLFRNGAMYMMDNSGNWSTEISMTKLN